ncbi:MAG: hypothetical protein RLZZ568_282 [Cyanobacteriota bacterium]|jgi:hypothetical protein
MLQASEAPWTASETQCAHTLLKTAYEREVQNLLADVQAQVSGMTQVEDLWKFHDFLSAKRHEIDGKYDERESVIIFVFAQLLKDCLIDPEELDFLSGEKRAKIKALARL